MPGLARSLERHTSAMISHDAAPFIAAIAGDIIGSVYESRFRRIKAKDFPLFAPRCGFTDDSVLADAVIQDLWGLVRNPKGLPHSDRVSALASLSARCSKSATPRSAPQWCR
jgi:hypothetical protein